MAKIQIFQKFKKLLFFFIIFYLVRSYYLRKKKFIKGPTDRKRITSAEKNNEKEKKNNSSKTTNSTSVEKTSVESSKLSIPRDSNVKIQNDEIQMKKIEISSTPTPNILEKNEINVIELKSNSIDETTVTTMATTEIVNNIPEKIENDNLINIHQTQTIENIENNENKSNENVIAITKENIDIEITLPTTTTREIDLSQEKEKVSKMEIVTEKVEEDSNIQKEIKNVIDDNDENVKENMNDNNEKTLLNENLSNTFETETNTTPTTVTSSTPLIDIEESFEENLENEIKDNNENEIPIVNESIEETKTISTTPPVIEKDLITFDESSNSDENNDKDVKVEENVKESESNENGNGNEENGISATSTTKIEETVIENKNEIVVDKSVENIMEMMEEPSENVEISNNTEEKEIQNVNVNEKKEEEIEDDSTKSIDELIDEISKIVNESEPENDIKGYNENDADADDEDEGEWIDEDEDEWIDEDEDEENVEIKNEEKTENEEKKLIKSSSIIIDESNIKPIEPLNEKKPRILTDDILDRIFRNVDPQTMWVLRNSSLKTRKIIDNILKETFEQYDLSMDPLYFDVTSKENLGLVLNTLDLTPFALAMLLFEILNLDSQHIGFAFGQMFRVPSKIDSDILTDLIVETLCILKTKKEIDISVVMVAFQRYYCFNHSELEFYRLFYLIEMTPQEVANFILNHYHFIPSKSLTPLLTALEVDEAFVAEMCKHYANDDLDALARMISKIPVQLVRTSIHPSDIKADHVMMINEEGEDIIIVANDDDKVRNENDEWLEDEDGYSENEEDMIIIENNESFSIFVGRILRFLNMSTKDVASFLKYLPEYCTYEEDEILEGLKWTQEQIDEMRNKMKEEQDKIAQKMKELSKLITQRRMSISAQANPSPISSLSPSPFL